MRLTTNFYPEQEGWVTVWADVEVEAVGFALEGPGEYLWPGKKSTNLYNTLDTTLENFFSSFFSSIPEVEYVFLDQKDDRLLNVLTFINSLKRDVREKIYEVEQKIMAYFDEANFNFHVIARSDRPIERIRPNRGVLIYKRSS